MKRLLWVVLVVLVVASVLPKPASASGSVDVEISDNLKDYVTVEMENVPEDLEKIQIEVDFGHLYVEVHGHYIKPNKIQLPNGAKVKPITDWEGWTSIDILYPGEWVLYYDDYGFVVHFRVPKIKVNF